jgi:hypothetical protein
VIACRDEASSAATDGDATTPCSPLPDPTVLGAYAGITPDGHYVVITGDGGAARAFYGTASHMVEGRITRTLDSCAHEVGFNVQGRSYTVVFAGVSCSASMPSKLVLGDGDVGVSTVTQPLTVLVRAGAQSDAGVDAGVASSSASSLMFFCF